MQAPAPVQRAYALALRICAALAFLAPLLSRLFLAHAFWATGGGKLEHPEKVAEFFSSLGIPAPGANAWFVSHLEYYGAVLLLVGLATRPVAAMLAGSMVVALLTADKDGFLEALAYQGQGDITSVSPLVLLVPLVWLVLSGPGLLSLDALVARMLGLKPPASGEAPAKEAA